MKKFTWKQYKDLQNLSLADKIIWSEQVILNALKSHKYPYVACSWGKDSIVMLHLIRKFCKDITVVFNNTMVEYPETYKYRDRMLQEWKIKNYYETKPIKDFWRCVKEYGYPKLRSSNQGNTTPQCCKYLKDYPAKKLSKEKGFDCAFIGILGEESMQRRLLFIKHGYHYFVKKENIHKVQPIIIWKDEDIYEYVRIKRIPMNQIYSKLKGKMARNGCMPCTGFIGWEKKLAKLNFPLYRKVQRDKGQILLSDCEVT